MRNNKRRNYWLLFILPLLASCAANPARVSSPLPAGYLYEGDYVNIRVPNSEGWYLVNSSPSGMGFARYGDEEGETFAAQVILFPLKKTKDGKAFLSLIKQGLEGDTDSSRFEMVKSEYEYTETRGYPCVKVAFVTKDNEAKTAPTKQEKLLLQANSLYCRHPVRKSTGFSIMYSHRGKSLYPNLEAEAKDFISGVQVPGH